MTYEIIEITYIIVSVVILLKILKVYVEMFISFMLNQENIQYDNRVEKPRLLFHILGIMFIGLSFLPIDKLNGHVEIDFEHLISLFSSLIFFILGVVTICFSWSKKFRYKYVPMLEKKIKEKYKLKIKESVNVENYVKKFIETSTIDPESENDLTLFLNNRTVNSTIVWTAKTSRSKQISYISLFNFLDEVVEGGFMVKEQSRNIYLSLVTDNFIIERVAFKTNVPSRYSEWLNTKVKKHQTGRQISRIKILIRYSDLVYTSFWVLFCSSKLLINKYLNYGIIYLTTKTSY